MDVFSHERANGCESITYESSYSGRILTESWGSDWRERPFVVKALKVDGIWKDYLASKGLESTADALRRGYELIRAELGEDSVPRMKVQVGKHPKSQEPTVLLIQEKIIGLPLNEMVPTRRHHPEVGEDAATRMQRMVTRMVGIGIAALTKERTPSTDALPVLDAAGKIVDWNGSQGGVSFEFMKPDNFVFGRRKGERFDRLYCIDAHSLILVRPADMSLVESELKRWSWLLDPEDPSLRAACERLLKLR